MKVIHISDLHLDSPLTARLDYEKSKKRKDELLFSFRKIVDCARESLAKAIIIAGDLFDAEDVGKRILKNVIEVISSAKEITFLYLSGNHEKRALERCGFTLPENLKIFGKEWTEFDIDGVSFIGRSETSPDMFSEICPSCDKVNVLVLHGELRDRSDYGGIIGRRDAEKLNVDYIALGHYHSYSSTQISPRCTAVYSGTPEGRGFDEIGPRGYVMLDIEDSKVSHRFVKSAKRTMHEKAVDVSDTPSDMALIYKIEEMLKELPREDLVRIRLVGRKEPGRIFNTDTILSSLRNSYYYVEVKEDTEIRILASDFKNDISLKGEFIRGVLADDSLSDKEKEDVINLGLSVLLRGCE